MECEWCSCVDCWEREALGSGLHALASASIAAAAAAATAYNSSASSTYIYDHNDSHEESLPVFINTDVPVGTLIEGSIYIIY